MRDIFRILFFAALFAVFPYGKDLFAQQDAQYSQYMFNRLVINPAYAGNRDVLSSTLVYRNQWPGMEGAPSTAAFSVQAPLKKKNAGVAVELITDKRGVETTTSLLASYAYHIQFQKGKLAFGLRTGFNDYVFDWEKVKVKDEMDVYNTGLRSSKITGTGDFGLYYYTLKFYCGLGLTHLNRGRITDVAPGSPSRQSIHFFVPVGRSFEVGKTLISPSILIKGTANTPLEIDLNFNVLLKERLWLGTSLRAGYGMVFLAQYVITDKMKAGYSYDYGFNRIGVLGKGAHEIMVSYDLNFKGATVETLRYF